MSVRFRGKPCYFLYKVLPSSFSFLTYLTSEGISEVLNTAHQTSIHSVLKGEF